MADTTSLITNDILRRAMERYDDWRMREGRWRWFSFTVGIASVTIAIVIAAGALTGSIADPRAVSLLAALAATLTLILTTIKPQAQALAFETASRDLQKAIFLYESDPKVDEQVLEDAVSRGTDLLTKTSST